MSLFIYFFFFFFFNDTATTEIYTLSLHDALPIYDDPHQRPHHDQPDGEPPGGVGAGSVVLAARDLGGRSAPGGAVSPVEADLRRRAAGRPRHGGDVAHLHLQSSGTRAPGH